MEKEVKVKKLLVVPKLPTTELRNISDNEGNNYECVTIEEALTEILEIVRHIKKVGFS